MHFIFIYVKYIYIYIYCVKTLYGASYFAFNMNKTLQRKPSLWNKACRQNTQLSKTIIHITSCDEKYNSITINVNAWFLEKFSQASVVDMVTSEWYIWCDGIPHNTRVIHRDTILVHPHITHHIQSIYDERHQSAFSERQMRPRLLTIDSGTYETYFILFLGLVRTWKVDAAVTKLGWTTCGTPFSKWPPSKLVELYFLSYNSVSNIIGDKILVSKPMFMGMRNPMITLKSPYESWLTQNSKWLPSKPAEITLIRQWAQYWQYTPQVPARNVRKLCYFITGTYSNMKSLCRHH